MDWSAIGAAGEVLAAAGVIVSLLYLAAQVRSNTRSLRASTFQAASDAPARFTLTLASNPQVALPFQRGLAGDEELGAAVRLRTRPSFAAFVDREILPSTSPTSTANYLEARPDRGAEERR